MNESRKPGDPEEVHTDTVLTTNFDLFDYTDVKR